MSPLTAGSGTPTCPAAPAAPPSSAAAWRKRPAPFASGHRHRRARDRPRQQGRVEQKAHQLRRREPAVRQIRARQGQHQHDADGRDQLRQRLQRGVDAALLHVQAINAVDLLAVARRFLPFAGVGLDRGSMPRFSWAMAIAVAYSCCSCPASGRMRGRRFSSADRTEGSGSPPAEPGSAGCET